MLKQQEILVQMNKGWDNITTDLREIGCKDKFMTELIQDCSQ
jgi:hypothetical protein